MNDETDRAREMAAERHTERSLGVMRDLAAVIRAARDVPDFALLTVTLSFDSGTAALGIAHSGLGPLLAFANQEREAGRGNIGMSAFLTAWALLSNNAGREVLHRLEPVAREVYNDSQDEPQIGGTTFSSRDFNLDELLNEEDDDA